jgi:transposase
MIEADKRKASFLLHQEGMSVRQIARRLRIGRNSVRRIIEQEGAMPQIERSDKQHIDPELLRRLYEQCEGRGQRVHEKLLEEEGLSVKYSTLTRMLRELGISLPPKERCDQVPDQPGAEMQHDTTVYQIQLGGQQNRLVASLLYLRYSKRRYLKFYRAFDRFKMKCFFHQALTFWAYAAGKCIVDNTNLARLRGLGQAAIIVPEMEVFAKEHGFVFHCHALRHPNRKAGEERSFWTVETNFLPGRTFQNLEDLNEQAFQWATQRMEQRPQGKAGLIPAQAFEHERPYLNALTPHLPGPYRLHGRGIDEYGFVALDANYYWVPGTQRDEVKVLQFADRLKIYRGRELLAEYPLPADGVRNKPFHPEGLPAPRHTPKNRKNPTQEEEKRLRAMAPSVGAYLDFAFQAKGLGRHNLIRQLLALSRRMSAELFIRTLERAGKYRITSIETIERIAVLQMTQGIGSLPLAEVDETFQQREAYQEGSLTEQPNLSIYDQLTNPNPNPNPNSNPEQDHE